jgi:hypothetical protein
MKRVSKFCKIINDSDLDSDNSPTSGEDNYKNKYSNNNDIGKNNYNLFQSKKGYNDFNFSQINKNFTTSNPNLNKKIKYCPIISKIIRTSNNKRFKTPVINSISNYLNFYEQLEIRLISKKWNEIVKNNYQFLKNENFAMGMTGKNWIKEIKIKYNINKFQHEIFETNIANRSSNSCSSLLNKNIYNPDTDETFNNLTIIKSDQKYSKKKALVKLISSKNFNIIKNKISLGEMSKPKKLIN